MSRHHHTKSSGGEDDFYAILGVATNSTETDIKRAYKKLALRYHPDKNPENPADAEIKFKRVTRAYEVLSCSDLRARYDRYGIAGLEGGDASSSTPSAATGGHNHQYFTSTSSAQGHHPFQGFGGGHGFAFHDPFEVFRSVFGGSDPFADMMDRHHRHHQKNASDHHHHHHHKQHHDSLHRHNQERHQPQQQPQQPAYGARGHPADPFRGSNNNTSTQRGGAMPRSRMMPPSSLFDHMMGGGFMGGGSMFNDDFFGGGGMMSGFGDMHQEMARHMKQASSMRGAAATGGSGRGCVSTSQSVSTVIRNGRRVTRTVVRKTDANGVTTEDVDEEIEDMGGNHAPLRHHHQSSIRGGGDGGKGQHQSIQY